ncbi:phage tail protein [Mediterraneibacter gnavus]|uniref:phage tail protein n=1 Tax=Mediterraneibacter gnavus TaxID=33038 RepID=UPI003567DA77
MARIGTFGSLTFTVSEKTVRTFESMTWEFSANYATHDRHIKADLLEFLGPSPDSISFPIVFSVFLGTNPLKEIKKMREIVDKGKAERLVIGGKVYGDYKWVMQKGTAELKRFDGKGNLWAAKVKVTLKEYAKR